MGLNKDSQLGFQRTQHSRRKNAFNFKLTETFYMLYSIVSAQRDNEGMLISDSSRFSSFDKLTMSVQFTVTSMYWSPPRWPSLWWSLSRPESFRCLVAELIRWSSQTMREVRLERS